MSISNHDYRAPQYVRRRHRASSFANEEEGIEDKRTEQAHLVIATGLDDVSSEDKVIQKTPSWP